MKRNLYLGMLVILLCAVLAASGTTGWFTARAESAGAAIGAGTLHLDPESFTRFDLSALGLFAPGQVSDEYVLDITNTGNLPLAWFGYFVTGGPDAALLEQAIFIDYARMEYLRPDGTAWEEADEYITAGTGAAGHPEYTALAAADLMGVLSLDSWGGFDGQGAGPGVQMGALRPGHTCRLTLRLGFAEAVTGDYQDREMHIEYKVAATQARADALNALGGGDGRIAEHIGDLHLGWLEDRLSKQD